MKYYFFILSVVRLNFINWLVNSFEGSARPRNSVQFYAGIHFKPLVFLKVAKIPCVHTLIDTSTTNLVISEKICDSLSNFEHFSRIGNFIINDGVENFAEFLDKN